MPIEVNRISRECPNCKNKTMFITNKGYFCNNCMEDFPFEKKEENLEEKKIG